MFILVTLFCSSVFFFQAEDGIRDLVRSRGLGDVYKRQVSLSLKIIFLLPFSFNSNVPFTINFASVNLYPVTLSLIHI